ncbi:MAG: type II secretion system F family protein [Terriglobales bacterium]
MPTYTFQGVARSGQRVAGERIAPSKQALQIVLRREQISPTRIQEKGKEIAIPAFGRRKVTSKDLAIFFRQFSVMIDAGLPLVQCLELIGGNQENPAFTHVLASVRTTVEGGSTLANAMRQHPKVFDDLTTNMVEAGETGGILDIILQRLASHIEKIVKLRAAVKSASMYPVTIIGFTVLIVFFLLWKIVPIFTNLFASLNATLPLPTVIVIRLSTFIGTFWYLILGFPLVLFIVHRQVKKTPKGRLWLDNMQLKLPKIGPVLRKIAIARFTRTLGTLITSGVPILDGLAITARTSGNAVIEQALMRVRRAVETGRTIIDPLRDSGIFPNMVVQMIGAGEQTGAMDAMLQKIGDFYEEEVDNAIKNLLALMEPIMIMILGVAVGGIVISMYLPMFSLLAQMSSQVH